MTPEQIDRVFGRGRLKMVTGEHVEVYREAVAPGERRRYTKRFLNTPEGDFGQWTDREWRILARLIGHGIGCVPDVVQFDRLGLDGVQLVQTYDAGVTVDQWATLLPVTRDGRIYHHVFEDCAHWWALAHQCLLALDMIHPLELVHLDIKGDNVCIPFSPSSFNPDSSELKLQPVFGQLALIDFAFALISRASLTTPLPIGWQKDYDYQSPRLLAALEAGRNGDLQPTRDLDWRCDLYSLAAMLKRYLPEETFGLRPPRDAGWTAERYEAAKALILRIREFHDGELPAQRPHAELIEMTGARLRDDDLALSLAEGWMLAREASIAPATVSPLTPVTLLAPPIRVVRSGRTAVTVLADADDRSTALQASTPAVPAPTALPPPRKRYERVPAALLATVALAAVGAALWYADDRSSAIDDSPQAQLQPDRSVDDTLQERVSKPAEAAVEVAADSTPAAAASRAPEPAPTASAPHARASESRAETPVVQSPAPDRPMVSGVNPATAPVESPDATRQEAAANSAAQARSAESRALASEGRKSKSATSTKQAIAAQRAAERAARAEAAAAPRTTQPPRALAQKETKEPPKERVYAPWASLEPPAWALSSYRGKGPGVPRGATAPEARASAAASSGESTPAPSANSVTITRYEPAPSNSQPASTPAAPSNPQPVATSPASPQHASIAAAPSSPAPVSPPTLLASIETPRLTTPVPSPSPRIVSANADRVVQEDYAAVGRETLREAVPRIAARAEPQIARVLGMAASAYHLDEERAVAEASRGARVADVDALPLQRPTAAAEARRLNDEARAAIRVRRDVREAMELQLRAFGANPRDPEIAGNLASLYLKVTPAQPEIARRLALVALAGRGPQYHSARMEDWQTLAIASALSGRESDARNALYVTLALTADVDTRCLATLNAVQTYGDRLRKPVEAMFYRLHTQGRAVGSQACAWPPNGSLLSRLQ